MQFDDVSAGRGAERRVVAVADTSIRAFDVVSLAAGWHGVSKSLLQLARTKNLCEVGVCSGGRRGKFGDILGCVTFDFYKWAVRFVRDCAWIDGDLSD